MAMGEYVALGGVVFLVEVVGVAALQQSLELWEFGRVEPIACPRGLDHIRLGDLALEGELLELVQV